MEMELDEQETPQKLTHKFFINYQTKNQRHSVSPCHHDKATPKNSKCLKKVNPRTPRAQSVSYSVAACSSMVSGNNSSLHSISTAVVRTPPAKRYQRVKNPFEAALADRLHLPLIASPSLFQCPNTPQMSSTQFEWTIDEVSSLKPANVEAHETQFQDSPDPDLEAKAQTAISSYFKEQQIVPSPIDCPLRSHRIVLSEINGNTPISKPGRRIRDCASQTELTFPTVLPLALEEALKPYFQPLLAGVGKEFKISECSNSWSFNSYENKDISLRRKLFDMQNVIVLENENQATPQQQSKKICNNSGHSNSSPISLKSLQNTAIVGKLSDSLDKSSFGSLSPISASDSLSPNCFTPSAINRKARFGNFCSEVEVEMISPIHPPARRQLTAENNRSQYRNQINDTTKDESAINNISNEGEDNERFTPERSSSPLNKIIIDNIAEFSADSFNIKVSRLKVNSSKTQSNRQERIKKTENRSATEIDIFEHDDTTEDMLENTVDMDEMQVSQLSGHSSNCSSSQSDTPRGKRRSASRKNLSQSFSANWLQDEDEDIVDTSQSIKIKETLVKKQLSVNSTNISAPSFSAVSDQIPVNITPRKISTFYRADSGFNEMSQNSSSCDAIKSQEVKQSWLQPQHEILVCCSTPSTKDDLNFV